MCTKLNFLFGYQDVAGVAKNGESAVLLHGPENILGIHMVNSPLSTDCKTGDEDRVKDLKTAAPVQKFQTLPVILFYPAPEKHFSRVQFTVHA
jgi:hypothetical protein